MDLKEQTVNLETDDLTAKYDAAPPKEHILVKHKPVYDFIKRAFDIFIALMCLTVGLPVYLILILAIVIDDPGNPFFVQKRVGYKGRVFRMVKFRTMYRDADNRKSELIMQNEYDCVHFKMRNDPRITKVGHFLRATSLDEIPQAVNLLTGGKRYNRDNQEKRRFFKGCRGLINFVMRFCTGLKVGERAFEKSKRLLDCLF